MSLQSRLSDLITAVGADIKSLSTRLTTLEQALVFSGRCGNGNNPAPGEYDWSQLGMGVELVDLNNGHAVNGTSWTVGKLAKYQICSHGCWNTNNNGRRGVGVQHWRGSSLLAVYATSLVNATVGEPTVHGSSETATLQVGDVLVMVGKQQGSGAIVSHLRDATFSGSGFDVIYLGP